MKLSPIKYILVTVLMSAPLLSDVPAPACSNPDNTTWFNLKTVTSFQVTQNCEFKFHGPNCESIGTLSDPMEEQGEVIFKTSQINDNSSCPFPGERSCKYVQLSNEILLSCGEKEHSTYRTQKEKPNLKHLRKATEEGDETAQEELVAHYLSHNQSKKSRPILDKMAKAKNTDAISALGLLRFYGSNGFKKNTKESLKWNRLAAEGGSAEAKYILGRHYFHGDGVKKSYPEAREWYQQAALDNHIPSQKALAMMWKEGVEGVIKKYDAKFWLDKAIALGDVEAATMLLHLDDEPIREVAEEKKVAEIPEPVKPSADLRPPTDEKIVQQPTPPAEGPRTPCSTIFASMETNQPDRSERYFEGIFLVKPYFLFQERQGAVPSVAIGITPGLQMGQIALKLQASVSLLNMALGDTFAAFDVATVLGVKTDTLFVEGGYGLDFWPEPGGTAQAVSVSVGKILTQDLLDLFPVKTISFGFSQTFFKDKTFKVFTATTF